MTCSNSPQYAVICSTLNGKRLSGGSHSAVGYYDDISEPLHSSFLPVLRTLPAALLLISNSLVTLHKGKINTLFNVND